VSPGRKAATVAVRDTDDIARVDVRAELLGRSDRELTALSVLVASARRRPTTSGNGPADTSNETVEVSSARQPSVQGSPRHHPEE
jgi:hypothetical protein